MVRAEMFLPLMVAALASGASGYKILCLMGMTTPERELWAQPLFKALAVRGHQLTIVSAEQLTEPVENIKVIHLERLHDILSRQESDRKNIVFQPANYFSNILLWYERYMTTCRGILASEHGMLAAMQLESIGFDLIIYDEPSCLMPLVHLFRDVPIMALSPDKVTPQLLEVARAGSIISPAVVPHFMTEFDEHMGYWQRLHNTALYVFEYYFRKFVVTPIIEGMLLQNPLVQVHNIPVNVATLRPRIKIVLSNTHPSIDYVHALPPNVIEVGGIHIPEERHLPDDIYHFIEKSKTGAVYISFGIDFRIASLGQEYVRVILDGIRRFPDFSFLWQVDNTYLITDTPPNLFLRSWFPQNEILGHPKVKAFLTHASSFSIQEAVHHAVPVIVLPREMEQLNNAKRVAERGLGLTMNFKTFSNNFYNTLSMILLEPKYVRNAERLQDAFHSRPQTPLHTAIWHVEQLLYNPECFDHLVAGEPLNFVVHKSVDMILLVMIFVVLLVGNIGIVLRQAWQSFFKNPDNVPDILEDIQDIIPTEPKIEKQSPTLKDAKRSHPTKKKQKNKSKRK